ncbi:ABC transporter ATP-binding protein [Desulfonema magnum]|uniref:ABC transporter, ATP-binding protein n=1 Tax=Desulfonema magnum TaxID=45655 RepID=A0A975GQY7_9BACT|nr:ABC transporter ATP-binding protein [Desulfonema magnum]QTA90372.1 putative ABC transporter, ATP-binding protein [Desulfonema magnum]
MKIRVENITKTYPLPKGKQFTVLKNINFTINEGDFVTILGESGCGKSTLLNILAGLLPVSSGEIWVDNKKIVGPHPSRSILFQQPNLLPWLSVEENIVFGCKLRGEVDNLRFRANQLIDIMGLSGFEKVYPHELSLGMAQRVCLARSLIGHPDVLLLDEPFASLDTFTRIHLQEELIDFWQVEKLTVIFVTHDIDEAILMGNKVILLGGHPSGIVKIFDIRMNYPRDMTSKIFFLVRTSVLKKFEEAFTDNKNLNPGEKE